MTNKQAMNMARKLEKFCKDTENCSTCVFNATPNGSKYKCAFNMMEDNAPCEWGSILSKVQVINENLMKEE